MKILVPQTRKHLADGEIFEIEQFIDSNYTLKPGTNIRNTLLITWHFIGISNKGRIVNFSNSETFKNDKLDLYTFDDIQKLINSSFLSYQRKFNEKMKSDRISLEVEYTAKEKETIAMMYLLNPRRVNFIVDKNLVITPVHRKAISMMGNFLNLVLRDLLPEIIKTNTFIEYQSDKDDNDVFALEVLTDDNMARIRVKTKIEIALKNWKGLN